MRASVNYYLKNYTDTMVSMVTAKGLSANLDRYQGGVFAKANAYKTANIYHIESRENDTAKAWKVFLNDRKSVVVKMSKEVLNMYVNDLNQAVNLFHKQAQIVK